MNQEAGVITLRAEAATDLSGAANLGRVAALDADGRVVLGGADGADTIGIIVSLPRAAGGPVGIATAGVVRARAGAAINEGDFCTSEAATGDVIPAAGGAASDDQIIGKCVQRGGVADGDRFDLLVSIAPGPATVVP